MYQETFVILSILCGILGLALRAGPATTVSTPNHKTADFKRFQSIYLVVYLLLMSSDIHPLRPRRSFPPHALGNGAGEEDGGVGGPFVLIPEC